jgi:hypothetical protein
LADYIASDRGRGIGTAAAWAALALGISLVMGLIGIGSFLFITLRSTP